MAYSLDDGRLMWEPDPVSNVDLDALLSGPETPAAREEQTDAEQVILDLLEDTDAWPLEASVALAAGSAHGIHERTLRRTARRMQIEIRRTGFGRGGRWLWHRPISAIPDNPAKESPVSSMSSIPKQAGNRGHTHIEDTKSAFPRAGARTHDEADDADF